MLIKYFCNILKLKFTCFASVNRHVWHARELWSSAWQLERCWCLMKTSVDCITFIFLMIVSVIVSKILSSSHQNILDFAGDIWTKKDIWKNKGTELCSPLDTESIVKHKFGLYSYYSVFWNVCNDINCKSFIKRVRSQKKDWLSFCSI